MLIFISSYQPGFTHVQGAAGGRSQTVSNWEAQNGALGEAEGRRVGDMVAGGGGGRGSGAY